MLGLSAISEELQPYRALRASRLRGRALELRQQAAATSREQRKRGLVAPGDLSNQLGRWHLQRAEGLDVPILDRMRRCQARTVDVIDAATGEVRTILIGCNQASCRRCERARSRKIAKRIIKSLGWIGKRERLRAEERKQTANPVLLTFTVRHLEGWSTADDAETMRRAWVLFRARWWHRFKFAFTFFRFEEVSGGRSSDGHLHWHLAAWWPNFDWKDTFQRWWTESVSSARDHQGADIIRECGAIEGNVDVQVYGDDKAAAVKYAAKVQAASESNAEVAAGYASGATDSKVTIDIEKTSPAQVAAYLDFCYGRRRFTCSRGILPRESGPSRFYLRSSGNPDQDQEPLLSELADRALTALCEEMSRHAIPTFLCIPIGSEVGQRLDASFGCFDDSPLETS